MARLIPASFATASARAVRVIQSLCDRRCAEACQLDLDLMMLRTNLTRHSHWSAAGIQ